MRWFGSCVEISAIKERGRSKSQYPKIPIARQKISNRSLLVLVSQAKLYRMDRERDSDLNQFRRSFHQQERTEGTEGENLTSTLSEPISISAFSSTSNDGGPLCFPETPTPPSRLASISQIDQQTNVNVLSSSTSPSTPTRPRSNNNNSTKPQNPNLFPLGIGNPSRISNANRNQASPARSRAQLSAFSSPSKGS